MHWPLSEVQLRTLQIRIFSQNHRVCCSLIRNKRSIDICKSEELHRSWGISSMMMSRGRNKGTDEERRWKRIIWNDLKCSWRKLRGQFCFHDHMGSFFYRASPCGMWKTKDASRTTAKRCELFLRECEGDLWKAKRREGGHNNRTTWNITRRYILQGMSNLFLTFDALKCQFPSNS